MSVGKNRLAARVRQFVAGAKKRFPNRDQPILVGGTTFTVDGLTSAMQRFVDNREAVEVSKSLTKAKVEIERVQAPSQLALVRAFETVLRGMFGDSPDALADFGLAPRKLPPTRSTEEKAVIAAKRVATRKARGTMGKNQKKTHKGSITAKLVVTPVIVSPEID
jgi:hypothetical protein